MNQMGVMLCQMVFNVQKDIGKSEKNFKIEQLQWILKHIVWRERQPMFLFL